MSESTNLRQATAKIEVEGLVSEKNLEETVDNGKGVIKGDITVLTTADNYIKFNVFVNQYKSDGKGGFTNDENSLYAGMQTIMEQYKSIADVGTEEADKIKITNGQISPQTYFDQSGLKKYNIRYQSNFFNRLKSAELEAFSPKAEFTIELYITSLVPETAKVGEEMEETGRLLVNGWVVGYKGLESITLIAPKEDDIAVAISDNYEVGQTVEFTGEVINQVHTEIITIPVKIGKPKTEKKITYKNELIITGASEEYEDVDEGETPSNGLPAAYKMDAIQTAVSERDLKLAEAEKKAKEGNNKSNTSGKTANAKPKSSGRKMPSF